MADGITDPFPNLNGAFVEAWTRYFIPYSIWCVITYPNLDIKVNHVSKRGPWDQTPVANILEIVAKCDVMCRVILQLLPQYYI